MRARTVFMLMLVAVGDSSSGQICAGTAGPNIVVGEISAPGNYAATGGIDAVSFGTTLCNFGQQPVAVQTSSSNHPIVMQNLYRHEFVDGAGRFEQIGMSWIWHSSFLLEANSCCTCVPVGGGNLGAGCSSDSTAFALGSQANQGPRHELNAFSATFPYPPSNPTFAGTTARRLQFALADVDPMLHPGALFFLEQVVLAPGDASAGNALDNHSFVRVNVFVAGGEANLSVASTLTRGQPAISAWPLIEPSVTLQTVQVPGEGRFMVAANAVQLPSARWRYEYAVANLDSHFACGAVRVGITNAHVASLNVGFHDVSYHDGDGPGNVTIDGASWAPVRTTAALRWSTGTFATDPGANALRAATLYNFRFDAGAPPTTSTLDVELWRSAGSVSVSVPSAGAIVSAGLAYCFGDGSGTACPCSNPGSAGRGCNNSLNTGGGLLLASGTPSLLQDTFSLLGETMNNSSCLYFQAFTQTGGGSGAIFGDGLRCASGSVVRLGIRTNASGSSTYGFLAGDTPISVRGNVTSPGTRTYQAWYRDPQSFCTSATYNLTNGISATWVP